MTPHEIANLFAEEGEEVFILKAIIERCIEEQIAKYWMIRQIADDVKCKMGCGR